MLENSDNRELGERHLPGCTARRCSTGGENENNPARAFRRAEQEGALLLIDEVDSFLQDRRGAARGGEIAQVNEMLARMKSARSRSNAH
jgi:SpoVK/Ycf46/Vps4 family AAA+-type ATPase